MKWTLPFLIVLFSCGKSFNSDAFKRPDKEPEEAQEFQDDYDDDNDSDDVENARVHGV